MTNLLDDLRTAAAGSAELSARALCAALVAAVGGEG